MSEKLQCDAARSDTFQEGFSEKDSLASKVANGIEFLSGRLAESMHTDGYWEGCLSSSPLSTATAISALSLIQDRSKNNLRGAGCQPAKNRQKPTDFWQVGNLPHVANCETEQPRISAGVAWLAEHAHPEGGWGDTADSPSNLATTLLVLAALKLAADDSQKTECLSESTFDFCIDSASGEMFASALAQALPSAVDRTQFVEVVKKAIAYLKRQGLESQHGISEAIQCEYGKDRTFAVPILMNCALAGFVDWADIPGLPFEFAVFPSRFYKALRLHVVSYAMPALIAIGLLLDRRNPSRNIFKRLIRKATAPRVLKILRKMQPSTGGFLEAVPLTSFVAMGLIPLFGKDQLAAADCLKFLQNSQRSDGSWPIDSNLSVWLTTSAVVALSEAKQLPKIDCQRTTQWIAKRQYVVPHPFTHAAPGGWAWTHLDGGVPDADDTSGAILALAELAEGCKGISHGAANGTRWLLDLQNGDGGWPTFCRGWGKLPFDRSSPDITAHVLRALRKIVSADCCNGTGDEQNRIQDKIDGAPSIRCDRRIYRDIRKGLKYLTATQQADGSWIPLWFGNQAAPDRTNPVVGTSLVLRALEFFGRDSEQARHGVQYLLQVQNADGGWGGAASIPSTLEETAQAVAALVPWGESPSINKAIREGVLFLLIDLENAVSRPNPIGLYFSHLWYAENLYPPIWTLEALGRVLRNTSSPV
jgi:squalene-hopene/tetraprenyl-beta-curcumene cyclase